VVIVVEERLDPLRKGGVVKVILEVVLKLIRNVFLRKLEKKLVK